MGCVYQIKNEVCNTCIIIAAHVSVHTCTHVHCVNVHVHCVNVHVCMYMYALAAKIRNGVIAVVFIQRVISEKRNRE